MISCFICTVLLYYVLTTSANCKETFTVINVLGAGQLRGRRITIEDKQVDAYLGIPFAKPPIEELRFAAPVYTNLTPWKDIKNFTSFKSMCPQQIYSTNIITGSEDCLYLNIYVPVSNLSYAFPVMIWIHGGSYVGGSASQYDGSILAAKNDIIVITINFRLGVLGFFNMPTTDIKGNYAILDQLAAFKWVKENIIHFKGNSDNVTIAGVSSGGICVSLHLISNLGQGLFSGAISMSGTAFCSWAVSRPKDDCLEAKLFGESIGCNDTKSLIKCLRNKPWRDIVSVQLAKYSKIGSLRRPVVDGVVIPDIPTKLNISKVNKKVNHMLGFTANEGTSFSPKPASKAIFRHTVINNLKYVYGSSYPTALEDAVIHQYTYSHPSYISSPWFYRTAEFVSDLYFTHCTVNFAKAWLNTGRKTYLYQFNYLPTKLNHPNWKVAHTLDVTYLFGQPFQPFGINVGGGYYTPLTYLQSNFTARDRNMSYEVMKIWTDFVKHGELHDGKLSSFTEANQNYIDIDYPLSEMNEKPLAKRMAFWDIFVPKLLNFTREKCQKLINTGQQQTSSMVLICCTMIIISLFTL